MQLTALYALVLSASGAAVLGITIVLVFGFRATSVQSITGAVRSNQFSRDFVAITIGGAIALAIVAVASVWVAWLLAGRVLSPLRSITLVARDISATSLDRRLALDGPDDELKELGDTFDGLLGRLDASFSAQRQFVANASHELRTPLARLKTLTQVALSDPSADAASLRTAHERVLASEQQLEQLIDALLTLAEGEQASGRRAHLDLGNVAARVLDGRTAEIEGSGLRLDASLEPTAATGDPRLVERLLDNLVDNAIRHNEHRGWIQVSTRGGAVSVANGGAPISAEELEQIKQPFSRGAGERPGRADGYGLGLSIVQAIAAAHGAVISVSAPGDGGLRVEVQFPPDSPRAESGD
jgi:signal transduction histidine kinase